MSYICNGYIIYEVNPVTPLLPHPAIEPTMPSRRQTRSSTSEARRAATETETREMMQQHKAHTAVTTVNTGVSAAKEKSNRYRARPSKRPKKVKIMTSKIPNAGLGLYLLEDAKKKGSV